MMSSNESSSFPNIGIPRSTLVHTPRKPEELHPLTQKVTPCSLSLPSLPKFVPLGPDVSKDCPPDSPIEALGFSSECLSPSAKGTNSTEEP